MLHFDRRDARLPVWRLNTNPPISGARFLWPTSFRSLPSTPQSAARTRRIGREKNVSSSPRLVLFPSSDLIRLLQLARGPAWLRYRQTTNEPPPRFYRPALPLGRNLCDIQRLKRRIGSRLSDLRRAVNYITVSRLPLICPRAVTAPVFCGLRVFFRRQRQSGRRADSTS